MQRFALFIGFLRTTLLWGGLAFAAGCGQSVEHRLLGTWEGKFTGQEAAGQDDANPAAAVAAVMRDGAHVSLVLRLQGEMEMHLGFGPMKTSLQGAWRVVSSGGDAVNVELIARYPQSELTAVSRGSATFLDADTIEFVPEGHEDAALVPLSRPLKLKRVSK